MPRTPTEFFDKSKAEIDASIASLRGEHKINYGSGLETLKRPFEQFKSVATDPAQVAKVIAHIIRARNPHFRHLVGLDANVMYAMVRFLPTRLRQGLLAAVPNSKRERHNAWGWHI